MNSNLSDAMSFFQNYSKNYENTPLFTESPKDFNEKSHEKIEKLMKLKLELDNNLNVIRQNKNNISAEQIRAYKDQATVTKNRITARIQEIQNKVHVKEIKKQTKEIESEKLEKINQELDEIFDKIHTTDNIGNKIIQQKKANLEIIINKREEESTKYDYGQKAVLELLKAKLENLDDRAQKYDRQLVLDLGSGMTAKALKDKGELKHSILTDTIDLKNAESDRSVLGNITYDSCIYIVGHGEPGTLFIESDDFKQVTAEEFAQMIAKGLEGKPREPHQSIKVSVIACYGGVDEKSTDSFGKALSKELAKLKIQAEILARMDTVSRTDFQYTTGDKYLKTVDGVSKEAGMKVSITTDSKGNTNVKPLRIEKSTYKFSRDLSEYYHLWDIGEEKANELLSNSGQWLIKPDGTLAYVDKEGSIKEEKIQGNLDFFRLEHFLKKHKLKIEDAVLPNFTPRVEKSTLNLEDLKTYHHGEMRWREAQKLLTKPGDWFTFEISGEYAVCFKDEIGADLENFVGTPDIQRLEYILQKLNLKPENAILPK